MNKTSLLYFFILLMFISSCSNLKYLQEGEMLYTGAKVKIEGKDSITKESKQLKTELEKLLRPKPNTVILGMRPSLYIYNVVGPVKKEKGFKYWLKTKIGEPPVLVSQLDLKHNKDLLQNYTENKGYFNSKTKADTIHKGKTVSAIYTQNPGKQYTIRTVKFPTDTSALTTAIQTTIPGSFLKVNEGYSFDKIKEERIRINNNLKEEGYYYFDPDYLKVQVDSTVSNHQVDLIVKVKNDAPAISKKQYRINKIIIYPNYSVASDTAKATNDSVIKHHDFTIYDSEKLFKPEIFDQALTFKKGDLYNRTDHNLSLKNIENIGAFKFVKNKFVAADTTGNYLDAYYYLTPLPKKSIRLELLAKTNSANYNGTELNLNWSNRNFFGGAELFNLSIYGGFEVQVSGQNTGYNVYTAGTEANLLWPKILSPFKIKPYNGFMAKTKVTAGYEYQNRTQLYSLQTMKASFGYLWKSNERKEHQLNIAEITYARPKDVTALYQEQVDKNPSLENVVEQQLVFGPTYSYIYSNIMKKEKRNTIYYKGSISLSGNLAGLITSANIKKKDTVEILGVPFSQFVRLENEFKHYLKLGKDSQLASRMIVGAGFAYGNSNEMPYISQFFIGGTNSIRAFKARAIGPGTYYDPALNTDGYTEDQSGDLKLELNTEYRTKLYRMIKGAAFIDAGNIWLLHDNPNKPGAKFSSDFMNELAVGVGVGLRFDLSVLIFRTDLAFPIRKPYLPDGNRWVIDSIDFGSGSWRNENLIFNIAIGYPF
ncbi:BamA/TamA family outer membrane protein [Flavobacterium aestivum]|uniref:translocation and assembly module lipoprotein TamL n=1 Tax=Flavobacterium aestivum TaxID=3003257 RepID=UPI0024821878|nr:BamA/TamA family outer membrane protein [Flavobacterium aestivum]